MYFVYRCVMFERTFHFGKKAALAALGFPLKRRLSCAKKNGHGRRHEFNENYSSRVADMTLLDVVEGQHYSFPEQVCSKERV